MTYETSSFSSVIFDVDGTLIDSVEKHAKAWQEAFERHGKMIEFEAIRLQIGKGGDQLMPVFLTSGELESIGKKIEEDRVRIFRKKFLPSLHPFPRVRELLERIRNDRKRVVLGSSAMKEEVEEYLRIAEIEDLVEAFTSKDDVEKSKPHPDIFCAALEKLDEEDAIVVGDSPYDAQAARRIGLETIGVLCGGFLETDLRRSGCRWIYHDPAELLEKYDGSPLAS